MELSPRSSFAAWSEIVRGTALPWTNSELALGRAFGASLVDIIVQINAVRLLIAEHQIAQIRRTVGSSAEPVVIADAAARVLFGNDAFATLSGRPDDAGVTDVPSLFVQAPLAGKVLAMLRDERRPWHGELDLVHGAGGTLPVTVRAEVVPARDGSVLGFFLIVVDRTGTQRVSEARQHLERSLSQTLDQGGVRDDAHGIGLGVPSDVMGAILANASLAAMDIADGNTAPGVAPLLEELEASTRRAARLFGRIRLFDA
jgi:hypothetical protein